MSKQRCRQIGLKAQYYIIWFICPISLGFLGKVIVLHLYMWLPECVKEGIQKNNCIRILPKMYSLTTHFFQSLMTYLYHWFLSRKKPSSQRGCRLEIITDQVPCQCDLDLIFWQKNSMHILFISMLIKEYQKMFATLYHFKNQRWSVHSMQMKHQRCPIQLDYWQLLAIWNDKNSTYCKTYYSV